MSMFFLSRAMCLCLSKPDCLRSTPNFKIKLQGFLSAPNLQVLYAFRGESPFQSVGQEGTSLWMARVSLVK